MMKGSLYDVLVIGGGHAGLSLSFYLKHSGINHLVLEQHAIGNSWSSQRWDSFKLNSPNQYNLLPGMKLGAMDPDGFCSALEFVASLKAYAESFGLPVIEQSQVLSAEKPPESDLFSVSVMQKGATLAFRCKKLVVASGIQNQKMIPAFAANVSPRIHQLHASEYRNAHVLPDGAVLVVGSGQSGVQIAEDLSDSGKSVYLSTGMAGRIPRRYRGKDIFDWLELIGFNDHTPEQIPDPQMLKVALPQLSGIGVRGKTMSLQSLAKKGVVILGRTEKINGYSVDILPDAAEHVKFADSFSKNVKNMVDDYIEAATLDVPLPESDPADLPDEDAVCASRETSIHLKKHHITSIIWSTGFQGDFSFLKLPVLNNEGTIKHKNGISEIDGLFFLGFPWLRKRKSGIVFGIDEDAKFISEKILGGLKK